MHVSREKEGNMGRGWEGFGVKGGKVPYAEIRYEPKNYTQWHFTPWDCIVCYANSYSKEVGVKDLELLFVGYFSPGLHAASTENEYSPEVEVSKSRILQFCVIDTKMISISFDKIKDSINVFPVFNCPVFNCQLSVLGWQTFLCRRSEIFSVTPTFSKYCTNASSRVGLTLEILLCIFHVQWSHLKLRGKAKSFRSCEWFLWGLVAHSPKPVGG